MEFREHQYWPGWVWILLGGVGAISGYIGYKAAAAAGSKALWASWPGLFVVALMVLMMRMTTRVDADGVTVVFGLVPLYTKKIAFSEIVSAEAETYQPLREFGGWGLRGWGDNRAINMAGNQGVRLHLQGGKRLLIGSQRAEELAQAIRSYRLG
ncbi:MAG: hypothetical protein IT363_14815 [Methanoregulaceae archaeon]|nr:hypothetical protein [Methanoregulaceae archaeon]